jgi:hypothetical protein
VLVPLEHNTTEADIAGGFALIDISAPSMPRLVLTQRLASPARVYCAAFSDSGRYFYVFGADDSTLHVFSVQ